MKIKNSHKPRPIYKFIRNLVRAIRPIDIFLMHYLRKLRVQQAGFVLKMINYYPDSRNEILKDYSYSIRHTHRGVMQVLNLETTLRYIESLNIDGAVVETGTFTGGASAYSLLALLRLRNGKPARDYWGFDSFEGMPTPTTLDGDHGSVWLTGKNMLDLEETPGALIGHETNKAEYEECLSYLMGTNYPAQNIHLIKGWFQDTLPVTQKNIGQIALLRLDGDFYESTKVVFDLLYEQVVPGGIVVIDDYGAFEGCRLATHELFEKLSLKPELVYVDNSIRYFIKPY